MIIGTTVVGSKSERNYFTPWFPRGADNAVFAYEVSYEDLTTGSIAVAIYHKDTEDAGSSPGSPTGSFAQLSSTDFYQATVSGLKEMVRFKITVSAQADAGESAVFRFLEPTWYSTAIV